MFDFVKLTLYELRVSLCMLLLFVRKTMGCSSSSSLIIDPVLQGYMFVILRLRNLFIASNSCEPSDELNRELYRENKIYRCYARCWESCYTSRNIQDQARTRHSSDRSVENISPRARYSCPLKQRWMTCSSSSYHECLAKNEIRYERSLDLCQIFMKKFYAQLST